MTGGPAGRTPRHLSELVRALVIGDGQRGSRGEHLGQDFQDSLFAYQVARDLGPQALKEFRDTFPYRCRILDHLFGDGQVQAVFKHALDVRGF